MSGIIKLLLDEIQLRFPTPPRKAGDTTITPALRTIETQSSETSGSEALSCIKTSELSVRLVTEESLWCSGYRQKKRWFAPVGSKISGWNRAEKRPQLSYCQTTLLATGTKIQEID